jgi:predicted alpha-1,6-mannanase (GH76 family)
MRPRPFLRASLAAFLAACEASDDATQPPLSDTVPSDDTRNSAPSGLDPHNVAVPDPEGGAQLDLGPAGAFRDAADRATAELHRLYDPATGLWPLPAGWWNAANAITALLDHAMATGSSTYLPDVANTFAKNAGNNFLNDYYDDEGWWALAWIRAFDVTNDSRYLAMAKTIFADMTTGWDDTTCNGGLWWRKKERDYKAAIQNELFLVVAVALHERTPGDGGAGSYLDWANREWKWFDGTGMINGASLVDNGLDSNCLDDHHGTWTYNQGVILAGLIGLSKANGDPSLLARARSIADATIKRLVDDVGVLREPCEPGCVRDTPEFKGIFMRNLAALEEETNDAGFRRFLAINADWMTNAARDGNDAIGLSWSYPPETIDGMRQSSAVYGLVAATKFSTAAPNLAAQKPATANGQCSAAEAAANAFDGDVSKKWCSASMAGTYWLQVDLGAMVDVGRVVVRHAGAGGEPQGFNTKDFVVRLSADAMTWTTAATVTGNTRPITIHRWFPATQARYVRLDITAPQSAPNIIAARIDDFEVYER